MQRYFAVNRTEDEFELNNDDLFHIKTVMRMKDGELIEVVYNHQLYLGIVKILGKEINIFIKEQLVVDFPPMPEINLIIPFLKEHKMDLILQKGTELGVSSFTIIDTERSIVKIDTKKESSKLERWSKICKEASEQSMRLDIPTLIIERDKEHLGKLEGIKIICSTTERKESIKKLLKNSPKCDKINLVIGPEGGLTLEEEVYFEKKGFAKVSLGARIMRAETVPIFLSSIINYEYME